MGECMPGEAGEVGAEGEWASFHSGSPFRFYTINCHGLAGLILGPKTLFFDPSGIISEVPGMMSVRLPLDQLPTGLRNHDNADSELVSLTPHTKI